MRIKTQLIVSMVILGAIFLLISASVISTTQQIDRVNQQEDLANKIVVDAYELSHLSNDYLLHQEIRQQMQWRSKFSSFSDDLAQLESDTPEQQTLVDNIRTDQQRLHDIFNDVASSIESRNDTRSKSADSEFIQVSWSRIGVQNQGIIFDASRLSHQFQTESETLQRNNTLLTFALLVILLIVLLFYFIFTSTRILRALSNLQDGTQIIGSGNLDYTIDESREDEIGDLSRAFNRMTENLKTVTASKADLEQEIDRRKRSEGELLLKNNVFESAIEGCAIADLQGNITHVNPAFIQLEGYTQKEELIGKSISSFFADEQDALPVLKGLESTGRWEGEILQKRKDSSTFIADCLATVIRDETGTLIGSYAALRDVTEERRTREALRESEERFRALFEEALDGIALADTKTGIILDCNPALATIAGRERAELIGQPQSILHPTGPEHAKLSPTFRQHRTEKRGQILETQVVTKAGIIRDVEIKANVLNIHGLEIMQGIFRDITERKRAEEDLLAKTRDLETANETITASEEELRQNYDELAKSQQALRETQEELVRKEKLAVLGKLSGGVGHELRNPLAAIKNSAYYLNLALENPEAEVKESIGIINKEVARCEDIISSLLDFARQKAPVQRTVSVNSVLKEALSRYNIPETITVINNSAEDIRDIQADPDKLMQVFGNLITNAYQAMPDGGTLTIAAENTGPDQVTVTVTDTGIGITEENREKMFEPLFTTKAKGIGLGLVVSKMIIDAHGGRIDARSVPGKGAAFTVTLPVSGKREA